MTGEICDYYPEDGGYPYSRTKFDSTPLSRIVEIGKPGELYAIKEPGNPTTKVTRKLYAANSSNPLLDKLPAGKYLINAAIDPDNMPVLIYKDISGREVAVIEGDTSNADGNYAITKHYYDGAGNRILTEMPNKSCATVIDNSRFIVKTHYDFLGKVIKKEIPDAAQPFQYIYNTPGKIRFMLDPNGNEDSYILYWKYDKLGRPIEEGTCNAEWNAQLLQANADNSQWLPSEGIWAKKYFYDGDGTNANTIGQIVQSQVCNGLSNTYVEETFQYDGKKQVSIKSTRIMGSNLDESHSSAYEYNNLGQTAKIIYDAENADSLSVSYGYNNLTQLNSIQGMENGSNIPVALFQYNDAGKLHQETLNPGTSSQVIREYSYNSPGWITKIDDNFFTESLSYQDGYSGASYYTGKITQTAFTFKGNINSGDFINNYNYQYVYDGLGRLKTAKNSINDNWSIGLNNAVTYDANGNITRLEQKSELENFVYYDGSDKLKNTQGNYTEQFLYNANGNITRSVPREINAIAYDRFTQMAMQVDKGNVNNSFAYDTGKRRVLKNVENVSTLYWLDTKGEPLLSTQIDGIARETTYYIRGLQGIIAFRKQQKHYTVLRDHMLSTRVILDDSNLIVASYNYLPYGGFMGPVWENSSVGRLIPYLFTGQELDMETGLYNFKARFYDVDTCRFYSTDPAGEFASPYIYSGDPVYFIDPTGEFSWAAFGAILGGIVLAIAGAAICVLTYGAATPVVAGVGTAVQSGITAGLSTAITSTITEGVVAGINAAVVQVATGIATASVATTASAIGAFAGAAAVGAGMSGGLYGATHTKDFKVKEWAASFGLGAAFGAITCGVGAVSDSIAYQLISLPVLGSIDGYVSNGVSSVAGGHNFNDGALQSIGFGVMFGFLDGLAGSGFKIATKTIAGGIAEPPKGTSFINMNKYAKGAVIGEELTNLAIPLVFNPLISIYGHGPSKNSNTSGAWSGQLIQKSGIASQQRTSDSLAWRALLK
jgi:RHS repeat-associated protein